MVEKSVPNRTIYWQHLRPNWVAFVVIALLFVLMLLYAISLGVEDVVVVGIFCAGPIFALPLVALALKSPPMSRVYMLGIAAVFLALTGVITAIGIALDPNEDAAAGIGFLFFFTVPFSFTLLIPLFFFLRQTVRDLREGLYENKVRRAAELVEEKGELTFAEAAHALDTSPEQIDNIMDDVKNKLQRAVQMYALFQRVYESAHLRQVQQRIVELIQARGQLYLDDLAIEMHTPRPLITEWVYQLVHDNRFTGFINWDTAVIYSTNAEKLRASSRCPNCNGQLGLDGERVRCTHCNSEILLGASA